MTKRKSIMKCTLSLILAVVMVLTTVPAMNTEAASSKTKSLTLYVGEAITCGDNYYSNVKSVSSTNKSVVSIKKDKDKPSRAIATAKKAGTATITVKTQRGTFKWKITVKSLNFKTALKDLGDGYFLVSVTNNTKQLFEDVVVTYSLYDNYGNEVVIDSIRVDTLIPNMTSYSTFYYGRDHANINCEASKAKVTQTYRSINYKYTNVASKITQKIINETVTDEGLSFGVSLKNTSKETAYGDFYVMLYDVDNNLIGIIKRSIYLRSGALDTTEIKVSSYSYPAYDHYKVIKRVYTRVMK